MLLEYIWLVLEAIECSWHFQILLYLICSLITVLWFVRRGPVGVSEKQEIFNNSFLPMSRSVDGFSMPVIEYAGELLSASISTSAK